MGTQKVFALFPTRLWRYDKFWLRDGWTWFRFIYKTKTVWDETFYHYHEIPTKAAP